VSKGKGITLT